MTNKPDWLDLLIMRTHVHLNYARSDVTDEVHTQEEYNEAKERILADAKSAINARFEAAITPSIHESFMGNETGRFINVQGIKRRWYGQEEQ